MAGRACARCRAAKVKCHHDGQPPCQSCKRHDIHCVFLPTRKERSIAKRQASMRPDAAQHETLPQDNFPLGQDLTTPSVIESAPEHTAGNGPSNFKGACAGAGAGTSPGSPTVANNLEGLYSKDLLLKAIDLLFLHFYTDIFFSLHEPSVRAAAESGTIKPVLAVAIIALTARFIPELATKHGSYIEACDSFAEAIRADLLLKADKPCLERIHALLLLGMHEWGSGRGARAWIYIGLAIRSALLLRTFRKQTPLAPPFNKPVETPAESIIEESRVRVFWSMMLMEHFVTSGSHRVYTTYDERSSIGLPGFDEDFLWGTVPRHQLDHRIPPPPHGSRLSEKSCLIAAVENWSMVHRWISSGGVKQETEPPWSPTSRFHQLRAQLQTWEAELPLKLQFNQASFSIHHLSKQAGPYGFLHIVHCTSVMFLHREYLQFFPDRSKNYTGRLPAHLGHSRSPSPSAPLTEETSAKDMFWKASLCELFTAAQRVTQILTELESLGSLMNTPFVGFAAFTSAAMNMYLSIFRHVYPELAQNALDRAETDVRHLKNILCYWPLAQQWYSKILRLYDYYKLFHLSGRTPQTPTGHVIKTFTSFDRSLVDYGEIKPGPDDMASILGAKEGHDRPQLAIEPQYVNLWQTDIGSAIRMPASEMEFPYELEQDEYWDAAAQDFLNFWETTE